VEDCLTPRTVLILWFAAGFVLEALYLVRRDPKWTQLAICAGGAIVATVLTYLKHGGGDPAMHVGIGLGIFGVLVAVMYQDEILPPVGDKLLLAFTLIFWFGFVTGLHRGTQLEQLLMFVSLLPTAATIYVAAMRPALTFWGKLGIYTWYLVIVVFLGWLQFPFRNLSIFDDSATLGWLGPIDALATGMASLYLLTNAYYLFELLPIPGRSQSFSDRMKDWQQLTNLMTQRCSDQDGPAEGRAFAIIGALGALLLLNYLFELLPNSLLISIAIILATMLLERAPIREALSAAAAAPPPVSRARRR
jgi:hypothetical protein